MLIHEIELYCSGLKGQVLALLNIKRMFIKKTVWETSQPDDVICHKEP